MGQDKQARSKKDDLDFAEFLIKHDFVSMENAMKAMDVQQERVIPIGQIAIRQGTLTVKEAFEVLNKQSDSDDKSKRFGEIAVEFGFLDGVALEKLLDLQIKHRPSLGEVLVELMLIDTETLAKAWNAYSA